MTPTAEDAVGGQWPPGTPIITDIEPRAAIEADTAPYPKWFESLRRQAQERQVELRKYVLAGQPADQILKTAAAQDVNLIVVARSR